LIRNIVMILS